MKIIKKTVGVILAVVIILSAGTTTLAAEADKADAYGVRYTAIQSLTAGLTINGAGLATCGGSVTLSNNTCTVYLTVALEKSEFGGWSTVTYWMSSGQGYTGTLICQPHYVSSGVYRVRSTATVFDSGGGFVEQATVYSSIDTY